MKAVITLIFASLSFCGSSVGQAPVSILNSVKDIKLLKSTRADVVKALSIDSFFGDTYDNVFFREYETIRIWYSSGKCTGGTEDEGLLSTDVWNVDEGKVVGIILSPKERIQLNHLKIDISKLKKERLYRSHKNVHIYYSKDVGTAITVRGGRVDTIELFPTKKDRLYLCNKKSIGKYFLSNNWRFRPEPKDNVVDFNDPANVIDLILSEIQNDSRKIEVITKAEDPEYDVVTYSYKISGGRIIGAGAKVVWDLTGVEPGTYKITAAVDDGCGPCGKYMTKSVVVK